MDTVYQAFLKVASLSGLIKPNILLALFQANLLLMLATLCSVLCNIYCLLQSNFGMYYTNINV